MALLYACLLWLLLVANTASAQDTLARRLGADFMKAPEAVGLSIAVYHHNQVQYYNFGATQKDH
jgi:hypothetical protein